MRKIYDVRCPNGHVNEAWFADDDPRETSCPDCNEVATKQIGSVSVHLDVASGDYPRATAVWLKDRQKRIEKEQRTMADHGTPR